MSMCCSIICLRRIYFSRAACIIALLSCPALAAPHSFRRLHSFSSVIIACTAGRIHHWGERPADYFEMFIVLLKTFAIS